MTATFYRIKCQANDFQEQPLYITANFVLMTGVVSNAFVTDQDNQLWQKIPNSSGSANYALVSAHTVNGKQYCLVSDSMGLTIALFDSSAPDNYTYWYDGQEDTIQGGQGAINIPGNTYYSGMQLILFNAPWGGAPNETWQFVS